MKERKSFKYEMADSFLYPRLKEYASKNRMNPTEAESILWNYLKGNFWGCHFRRQHIIGPYIADFACLSHRLIIELDGGYHQLPEQQISDNERSLWLENKGFFILRFTNEEVIGATEIVLNRIKKFIINEQL